LFSLRWRPSYGGAQSYINTFSLLIVKNCSDILSKAQAKNKPLAPMKEVT
jgi:hypothetical protein